MSAGVALAWATEALEKNLVSEKETLLPLKFGDDLKYREAMRHLAMGTNEFYRLLGQGTIKATQHYGGEDFACVLGQEMAGYATGEVFFTSQALGFRHSHLDAGGYAYDQKPGNKNATEAVNFLVKDERDRVLLTSMVACLFARNVYTKELLSECLAALGYTTLAAKMDIVAEDIEKLRWKTRFMTGFDPETIRIPERFKEISNWKGEIDRDFLQALQSRYAKRIRDMGTTNE
jgi:aldehyde:ferredoxin oxidoreductase